MFRPTLLYALTIILSGMATVMPVQAQGVDTIASYENLLAVNPGNGFKTLAEGIVEKSGSGTFVTPSLKAVAGIGYACATSTEPSLVFLVSAGVSMRARWSQAAWLSILANIARIPPGNQLTGVLMLAMDESKPVPPGSPGDPLVRGPGLQEALADMGVEAILVLDLNGPPESISLVAASSRRISPRRVLEAARSAANETGMAYSENAVADFYVAAGLRTGSEALSPWLDAGLPAIAIESSRTGQGGEPDLGAFSVSLARHIQLGNAKGSVKSQRYGDDVNYFRYPLPSGLVTIGDSAIVQSTLLMSAVLGISLATGLLTRRRRITSMFSVARESLISLALSVAAFAGAALLSRVSMALLGTLFGGTLSGSKEVVPLTDSLVVLMRLLGALSCYYTASGLLALLGLHGDHGRIEAMQAALLLFFLEALTALWFMPSVMPLLILAIVLLTFTAGNAAASGLGLLVFVFVAIPFADPRVFIDLGGLGGVRGTLVVSIFAAPLGLWIGVASSTIHSMRRGRSTLGLWILGAIGFALAEAALRLASNSI